MAVWTDALTFPEVVEIASEDLRDLRSRTREPRLRDNPVLWRAALEAIRTSTETQLAQKRCTWESSRAELEMKLHSDQRALMDVGDDEEARSRVKARMVDHQRALTEARGVYFSSKQKVLQFKLYVEQALSEARALCAQAPRSDPRPDGDAGRVRELEDAIKLHRATVAVDEDSTPLEEDLALWGVLG